MAYSRSFSRRPQNLLRTTLLCAPFPDELISGFLPLGLPLIEADLHLSYKQTGLLFTAGGIAAMLLEPSMNLLSDRGSKRPWVLGGMLCMMASFALAASAPNFAWLLVAMTCMFPASGAAVGLAQATLIDAAPNDAARTMTRWTLIAAVGDLLSPATVALVAALSLGWRPLFWLATLVWLVAVAVLWRQRFPRPVATPDDEDALSLLAGLRTALGTPHLLRWTAIALFASMLDEVFLGFAGLYLQNALGAVPVAISLALGAQMVGGLATLVVLDRVAVRWQPERLVAVVAVVTLAGVVMLLSTRSIVLAAAALFVIGAGAAGWYPIAKAQAYALLPGRSGTVRAVDDLGAPFEVALPLVVGALADRFGITAGMSVLGLAPLLVLLVLPRRIKP